MPPSVVGGSDGWEITMETDQIDVSTAYTSRPDKSWRYVDKAGHVHEWAAGGYAILAWVVGRPTWCGDCGEWHEGDGRYECILCGEVIEPATVGSGGIRQTVPGRSRYYLRKPFQDAVEITPDQAADLRDGRLRPEDIRRPAEIFRWSPSQEDQQGT